VVLDKAGAPGRRGIFMIDASKGCIKDGNKNRLRAQDMHRIVDTFQRQLEQPRYSRMVPVAEIEANDFNLNLPRYIDTSEPEDLQDIEAHLKGGIPDRDLDALAAYWQVLRPALSEPLRPELFRGETRRMSHTVAGRIFPGSSVGQGAYRDRGSVCGKIQGSSGS